MNHQSRRYVFIDFESLKKIKFKKLEKVCDKVFIFIQSDVNVVPLELVLQMQKMGNDVKWIVIDNLSSNDMNYHISFLMGKLHEKVNADVEFAVLSNDNAFDPLVNFINTEGRSCLRVKRKVDENNIDTANNNDTTSVDTTTAKATAKPISIDSVTTEKSENILISNKNTGNIAVSANTAEPIVVSKVSTESTNGVGSFTSKPLASTTNNGTAPVSFTTTDSKDLDAELIDHTAKETIRRLIRSGNRPAEISMLKNYILLHNQELSVHGHIDKIIRRMAETNEITIKDQEVIYNF